MFDNTLFGKVDKVQVAIDRLREHKPPEGYYLAFSGGKDSVCIYQLAVMAGVKFTAYYNDTTVDPPELKKFIREHYPQVKVNRPEKSMFQLIVKSGPPLRQARWCCRKLKECNPSNSTIVTGVRHEESARRKTRSAFEQHRTDPTIHFVNPIIDWTMLDVWEYIENNNFAYCSLYNEGFDRIGCILCPMTRTVEIDRKRWPKMFNAYRRAFRKFWERKQRETPDAVTRWQNFEEFWNWWLDRDAKTKDKNQLDIFN